MKTIRDNNDSKYGTFDSSKVSGNTEEAYGVTHYSSTLLRDILKNKQIPDLKTVRCNNIKDRNHCDNSAITGEDGE